jgi:tetratricopeptide (TPR) repeat protein
MKNLSRALLVLLLTAGAAASVANPAADVPGACADISGWVFSRPQTVIPSFKSPHITDECFAALVSSLVAADKRLFSDSLASIFSARAPKNRFTVELLFLLRKVKPLVGDVALWGRVVDIWLASSPLTPDDILAAISEGGKIPVADTLYRALDVAGRLDADGLLRYGRVKCLVGDYRAAAAIYCRAAADKRLEYVAVTQMEQLFSDADSAARSDALRGFIGCVLALPGADTAFYRNRIADFYGRHGHYGEEVSVLVALNTRSAPVGRRLADVARSRYSQRRYRIAAAAAAAAYGVLEEGDQARASAAFTAHQAYAQLHARDSALVWLRLSGATDKDAKIMAVALNQEVGRLDEAARLLEQLPPSLSKDTLAVRSYIFSGELGKALNHIASATTPSWVMAPRERLLWRARCHIFQGRPYDASQFLDSIKFVPVWGAASETLRYRYWLQKLDEGNVPPGSAQAWGRLEHCIYICDLGAAAKGLKEFLDGGGKAAEAGVVGGVSEALAVRLAGALAAVSRYAEALEVLETLGDGRGSGAVGIGTGIVISVRSPEYLYVKAALLNALGRGVEARDIAQKILKEYPADVFAQRARMLLAK